nr:hypothetical protein GCM10017611_79390 [Rhodococcus wratislaviensis]
MFRNRLLQIVGNKDPVHSVKGARWLTETLSNAKLVSLDGCGHYPMFGAPDAFEAALLEFSAAEERSLSVLRYRLVEQDQQVRGRDLKPLGVTTSIRERWAISQGSRRRRCGCRLTLR